MDLTDLVQERLKATQTKALPDYKDLKDSFVVGTYSMAENKEEECDERERNLKAWLTSIGKGGDVTVSNDVRLAIGALIVEEIRADIYSTLGFRCSAGVAHNKTMAKHCCGLNKPNRQTILPLDAHQALMAKTPIQKM